MGELNAFSLNSQCYRFVTRPNASPWLLHSFRMRRVANRERMEPVREADLHAGSGDAADGGSGAGGGTLSARRNSYLKEGSEMNEVSNKVSQRVI